MTSSFLTLSDEAAQREIEAVLADIAAHEWPTDIYAARELYDVLGPPVANDIRVEPVTIGTIQAQMLTPPIYDTHRALLFLHGGGYVYGSFASHGGMTAEIARSANCKTLQPDYRRAPENPFPAAIEDSCAAYEWLLLQGYRPEHIAFVGDSAGGGLVMATLVTLKNQNRPLPGAAVCISPWVDLEMSGQSYIDRQSIDPMIDRELAEMLARLYLNGEDRKDPRVSPIHADLQGIPPLLIQVGEREVLFSEAFSLSECARANGVEVTFEEWPQMVHVWHLYFPILTAGRDAIARVGAFVREKTRGTSV